MSNGFELDDLVMAAVNGSVPALHIVRRGDQDLAYARTAAGLAVVGHAPVRRGWWESAAAMDGATRLDDRVVIDLVRRGAALSALADLGMTARMRGALAEALHPAGGVVLVASPIAAAAETVMAALAAGPGERHVLRVSGGRAELDAAARMDCDAILMQAGDDRAALVAAFEHGQRGERVVLTVDADDALAALAWLRAQRIERHMLALALRAVIAVSPEPQLCPRCRRPDQASGSEAALLGVDPGTVIYRPVGCATCAQSGFSGNVLLFEAMAVDGGIRRMIASGGDAAVLARLAFVSAPTLAGSARTLAREGRITADAAIAVARRSGRATSGFSSLHPDLLPSLSSGLTVGG